MRRCVAATAVILVMALAGNAATPVVAGSRTVPFAGGEALITTSAGVEHVVVKDATGQTVAASDCSGPTGTYDQIVAFLGNLTAQVAAGHRDAVASLIGYPLRVNHGPGTGTTTGSRSDFLARYAKVITPGVAAKIEKVNPHLVFCRDGMAMGGDGVIWAALDDHGQLKVSVINQ